MGVSLDKNLVFPDELVLVYSGYWQRWSRVLYMQNPPRYGNLWVELNLTPRNPTSIDGWKDEVLPIVIRKHSTGKDERRDKLYRFVVRSNKSPVFRSLKTELIRYLHLPIAHRLLYEDILPQIDWPSYEAANRLGGGVWLADCQKRVEMA